MQVITVVKEGRIDFRIRLLDREQRHIQERLIIVNAVSATNDGTGVAFDVPRETNSWADVVFIVFNHFPCKGTTDDLKCTKGAVFMSVRVVDKPKVHVITSTDV